MGARVVTTRPKLFVKFYKRAALDHLGLEHLVFFDRTIDPMNGGRLGQRRHFLDPVEQVNVRAQGLRRVSFDCLLNSRTHYLLRSLYELRCGLIESKSYIRQWGDASG